MANMFAAIETRQRPVHDGVPRGRPAECRVHRAGRGHPRTVIAACGFVACDLRGIFDREPGRGPNSTGAFLIRRTLVFAGGADLVARHPPAASTRCSARSSTAGRARPRAPDLDRLRTLVDRPYLLSMMNSGWSAAIVREPMVWYRHHADGATRTAAMNADHRAPPAADISQTACPRSGRARMWRSSSRSCGDWLFELYRLTPPAQRPPVWRYLLPRLARGASTTRARAAASACDRCSARMLNRTS